MINQKIYKKLTEYEFVYSYPILIKSDEMVKPEIDKDIVEKMKECGIDICGENGEYHTLVVDGPVFKSPLPYEIGEIVDFGEFSVVDVR